MNINQNGFLSLAETLRTYKRKVTLREIMQRAKDEGWLSKLMRISHNTILSQIEQHNAKYSD